MLLEARLRAFAAVARTGSFSRAAQDLFVSQPAVSKHVAALERELATKLVYRSRSGAQLSPIGKVLADYVLRAEALLAHGRRAVEAAGDPAVGSVALGASGIPGTYLLPAVVARFRELYRGIEVNLALSTSGGTIAAVRSHDLELGIVGGHHPPPELESEPLVDDEIVLVGPTTLKGRKLDGAQLSTFTWISREEGSATRAAVDAACWEIGLTPRRRLELPSWEAVKLAVADGAGIAACSRFAVTLELGAATLAVLDVPSWRLHRMVSLVHARGVPLTPAAQLFLEYVRGALPAQARARLASLAD
jgi:DNA-binding transcriptional LysR family regulator